MHPLKADEIELWLWKKQQTILQQEHSVERNWLFKPAVGLIETVSEKFSFKIVGEA